MAERTDGYNFQAPQFIESLSEVKLDDGADTFFDADSAPKNENCAEDSKNFVESDSAKESPDNEDTSVSKTKTENKNKIANGDMIKENLDPQSSSKGPMTRLQRMSMKPNGPLGIKDQSKFLSVAEQLHQFHHSTPPRFKRKSALFKSKSCKFLPTIAHSPQLRTKIRAARPSTAPSIIHEEKPVKKIIKKKEFVAIKPIPKAPTVPVPFNLTMSSNKKQIEKKEEKTENIKEINKEKKQTFATPSSVVRKPLPVKKKRLEIKDNKLTVKESWGITGIKTLEKPNSTTKTVPFSFEKRNQERKLEKQRKLEEEKEQQNKASTSAACTPRKVLRPSTVAGCEKKVKDEGNSGRILRKSVK